MKKFMCVPPSCYKETLGWRSTCNSYVDSKAHHSSFSNSIVYSLCALRNHRTEICVFCVSLTHVVLRSYTLSMYKYIYIYSKIKTVWLLQWYNSQTVGLIFFLSKLRFCVHVCVYERGTVPVIEQCNHIIVLL